jgi:hypothetical protein
MIVPNRVGSKAATTAYRRQPKARREKSRCVASERQYLLAGSAFSWSINSRRVDAPSRTRIGFPVMIGKAFALVDLKQRGGPSMHLG